MPAPQCRVALSHIQDEPGAYAPVTAERDVTVQLALGCVLNVTGEHGALLHRLPLSADKVGPGGRWRNGTACMH